MSESNNTATSLSDELYDFCDSDSLTEEGIREIIERHGVNRFHAVNYGFFVAACRNERVTVEIIQCLLEYFPAAATATNREGLSPLHFACNNSHHVSIDIIELLVDSAPASIRCLDEDGDTPLHILCDNRYVDEAAAIEIMKFLIEKYPAAVSHANNGGFLPIIYASMSKSPEFCRVLLEAYPGSERMPDAEGHMPLHYACGLNTVATVEYLYKRYPEAIDHTTELGHYPIHSAICSILQRKNPASSVKIVQFLLDCDPNQKLKRLQGMSLLHLACQVPECNDPDDAALKIIGVIYDVYPEAIEDIRLMFDIQDFRPLVRLFIRSELFYARQAKDHRLMTTPDDNGRLPLHKALQNNVRLGSIKLLVKGNPEALQSANNSGSLPLHVACMHHDSVNVIQYLVELDTSTLDAVDRDGDTALHYACLGARYHVIELLLEKYGAVSVSTRNKDGKLPIDLLWESTAVEERSIEYAESVYRLLRANPEMMMGIDVQMMQPSAATSLTLPCQNRKKRKLDHED